MSDNKPKYEILKEYIINHIKNNDLHYNDAISSEAELMAKFDISRHTVRRGISDLVNEGWLYKHQGKGTFVSDPEANRSGHGKLVGVITTYINDYIFPEIIAGAEKAFSDKGYSIILGNTNNNVEKERVILTNMLNNNLAGLIIEPTKSVFPNHNKELFEQILKRGIPVLFIHATYQNVDSSYIVEDDVLAGYMAASYLIEKGHKKIGGIFKQDDMQGHGRYEGYLKALREASITTTDDDVLWYTTETKDLIIQENNKALRELTKKSTAVVVYNDQVASRLINIFEEMNLTVPEDISVISFDNANVAENVGLTTLAHPKERLGLEAANNLIRLMNNEKSKVEKAMKPQLVVRKSVKELHV